MVMKKIFISVKLIFAAALVHAQSTDQGFQQVYYERYQSAEHSFQQALQQNANDATAWYGLVRTYILENKMANTEEIRSAPASVLAEPYFEVAYGTMLLNEGKKDSASAYFNKALDQTKEKDAGILSSIAQAHIDSKNGDGNYAVDLLNKAIKRDKHNAALFTELGDAYRKLGNGSEAYTAYNDAIKENNHYAAAYHQLATIFLSQKNTELFLENFDKAVAADPNYAPSLYSLYSYYFYHDPAKALQYYNDYAAKSDHSIQNEYELADLLYINKKHNEAIQKAKNILASEREKAQPRLYKLIAYSYEDLKDSSQALRYMQQYVSLEEDSNFIAKDFETLADLYVTANNMDSSIAYYKKAVELEKDSSALYKDYKQLADLSKGQKDYTAQAEWLGKYYNGNKEATNVDLFNWALAHYLAHDYPMADSVFGLYTQKYPEQAFGYYWRARSNVAIDTTMTQGLAIPHYQKLVEVLQKDSTNANYKNWMTEAYGYLAAYEANTKKDYAEAIDYFEKVLAVDPENENAKKYISVLEKSLGDKSALNDKDSK
jgi:tetratricopeptide (TPR) repeat protein